MTTVRVRAVNDISIQSKGDYVLYWMIAFRRPHWNPSLDWALHRARELGKGLVVLEALRVDYPWASDRLHRFVIDGMAANKRAFEATPITYYPYVESRKGEGSGLLAALAEKATVVVTDDFPCFFLPRMIDSAGRRLAQLGTRLEAIDGNGLYPMMDTDRVFSRAFDFRRHLQRRLPEFLEDRPSAEPLRRVDLPRISLAPRLGSRWSPASDALLDGRQSLDHLPIDHEVGVVAKKGGHVAAQDHLEAFLTDRLPRYGDERNHPDSDAASGFSPFLHFGHLSPHNVFWSLATKENWSPDRISTRINGAKEGYWRMSSNAEAFLDELVTWRELGYNMCSHRDDYDEFDSLPNWAKGTLTQHASDERSHVYTLEHFESAQTHDSIWNAAQTQLVRTGQMQNYLRMLWGKKILEWTPSPEAAIAILIELNNKYALDGRNPNSYSGIFWTLGRYDRAWGPERKIFGKVRYMSSENTKRKLRLKEYLDRYGVERNRGLFARNP